MSKDPTITTQYTDQRRGVLAFDPNAPVEADIHTYLEVVRQVSKDFSADQTIVDGLREIETELQALRLSSAPEVEIRAKLEKLMQVPIGQGKTLRLDSFRKTAVKSQMANLGEYRDQVRKMVRNTRNNIAMLLLLTPADGILKKFLEDLNGLNLEDINGLRIRMSTMGQSPQLWHYNKRKKSFLSDWLRPFQELLGKPIEQMTEEEFQDALKQVEDLRQTKLEEMTNLELVKDRAPYRGFNRIMNPVMNGRDEDFWGSPEIRDEFVHFINLLILRFSFSLEERFLIFRTNTKSFTYLVGFSDDAFDKAVTLQEGKVGLYPHLKVLMSTKDGEFKEITLDAFNRNTKAYYSTLRTAVVPFLTSAALLTETHLSDNIKQAFDMWV
ncbi:MAG: hypothetical protein OEW39_12105 [Deltaproteobacteria bacterium]|nr:hypothetical protein [Deltaproteobacteria bacterium]